MSVAIKHDKIPHYLHLQEYLMRTKNWSDISPASFENGDLVINGVGNTYKILDVNTREVMFMKARRPDAAHLEGQVMHMQARDNFRYLGVVNENPWLGLSDFENGQIVENGVGTQFLIIDKDRQQVKFHRASRPEHKCYEGEVRTLATYTNLRLALGRG